MKVARDDTTVVLDHLVKVCMEASETHRAGASAIDQERMAATLTLLADDRAEAASFLAEEVRRLADTAELPPTREKAPVHSQPFASHLSHNAILDRCLEKERQVLACAEKALARPIAEPIRQRIERLRADAARRLDHP